MIAVRGVSVVRGAGRVQRSRRATRTDIEAVVVRWIRFP